jgi:hypothetical protein
MFWRSVARKISSEREVPCTLPLAGQMPPGGARAPLQRRCQANRRRTGGATRLAIALVARCEAVPSFLPAWLPWAARSRAHASSARDGGPSVAAFGNGQQAQRAEAGSARSEMRSWIRGRAKTLKGSRREAWWAQSPSLASPAKAGGCRPALARYRVPPSRLMGGLERSKRRARVGD